MLDWLVRDRELSQIMTNHFRLDFNLVECLAIVHPNDASYHLRHDDHIAQVGFDEIWLLTSWSFPFLIQNMKTQSYSKLTCFQEKQISTEIIKFNVETQPTIIQHNPWPSLWQLQHVHTTFQNTNNKKRKRETRRNSNIVLFILITGLWRSALWETDIKIIPNKQTQPECSLYVCPNALWYPRQNKQP